MIDRFSSFRLYGSSADRRRLRISATVFGALALASSSAHSLEGTIACSAVGATLLIISGLITNPEEECAYCRRPRRTVTVMVVGNSPSICDECAVRMIEAFAKQSDARKADATWVASLALGLPPLCPRALSGEIFRACVPRDEAQRMALIAKAFELDNPEAAEELILRSPEGARSATDWSSLGYAFARQGRFRDAIEAIERVQEVPEYEPWLVNTRVSALLELGPCDEPTLRRLMADNVRARELLESTKPYGYESSRSWMLACAAEIHRRLHETEEALACLESAVGGYEPTRLITHAQIVQTENVQQARELLERALKLSHPESREAVKARQLLDTLDPARGRVQEDRRGDA